MGSDAKAGPWKISAARNVFESEGAGEVAIETCPAFSGLKDDISEDPTKDTWRQVALRDVFGGSVVCW